MTSPRICATLETVPNSLQGSPAPTEGLQCPRAKHSPDRAAAELRCPGEQGRVPTPKAHRRQLGYGAHSAQVQLLTAVVQSLSSGNVGTHNTAPFTLPGSQCSSGDAQFPDISVGCDWFPYPHLVKPPLIHQHRVNIYICMSHIHKKNIPCQPQNKIN